LGKYSIFISFHNGQNLVFYSNDQVKRHEVWPCGKLAFCKVTELEKVRYLKNKKARGFA